MTEDPDSGRSTVDGELFEHLFKAARRGAMNDESATIAVGRDAARSWVDLPTETEEPPAEPEPERIDWPTAEPDEPVAVSLRGAGDVRPQGVAAIRAEPALTGWRGRTRRLTRGVVRPRAGAAERRLRAARAVLRSSLDRPLTVVFAHPGDVAGFTPVTLRAATAFGVARGGSVLATTLGARPLPGTPRNQERPPSTTRDLVRDLGLVRRLADLARFTQPLPSGVDLLPGDGAPPGADAVAAVLDLLRRYYTVLCVDIGTDVPDDVRAAAVAAADVLVVCCGARESDVDAATTLLDELRAGGHDRLADAAVGVVCPTAKVAKAVPRLLARQLDEATRTALDLRHRRPRQDDDLVNRRDPTANGPEWTFLCASVVDSFVAATGNHQPRKV